MKHVEGGKIYNTETAERIASNSYSNPTDFYYWSETLYRTKKGAWFLYCEGGAASQYNKVVSQNSWVGGEQIRTLSGIEAQAWLEKVDAEACVKYFQCEEA